MYILYKFFNSYYQHIQFIHTTGTPKCAHINQRSYGEKKKGRKHLMFACKTTFTDECHCYYW